MENQELEKFYQTGVFEDCIENFNFFKENIHKFLNGDKKLFKWTILSFFMFLQELFVLHLKQSAYCEYKNSAICKINGIKYKFKISLNLPTELYKVTGTTINLHPTFFSVKSFEILHKNLNNEDINVTKNQLLDVGKQIFKLLEFKKLFKKIKKADNDKIWFSNSNNFLNKDHYEISLNGLVELRNSFIHMSMDSWWIDYDKFYEIFPDCLNIAIFLIESSNSYQFKYQTEFKDQILPTIKSIYEKTKH